MVPVSKNCENTVKIQYLKPLLQKIEGVDKLRLLKIEIVAGHELEYVKKKITKNYDTRSHATLNMAPAKILWKLSIFDNPECTLPQFVLNLF